MSKKSTQKGDIVDLPAPSGGILSGEAALINGVFGVAQTNGAEDELTPFAVTGGHLVALTTTDATTIGARLYWDASAKKVTTSAATGSNKEVGVALSAESVGATEVNMLIGVRVGA